VQFVVVGRVEPKAKPDRPRDHKHALRALEARPSRDVRLLRVGYPDPSGAYASIIRFGLSKAEVRLISQATQLQHGCWRLPSGCASGPPSCARPLLHAMRAADCSPERPSTARRSRSGFPQPADVLDCTPSARSGLRPCRTPCKHPGFRRWRLHPGYAVAKVVRPRSIVQLSELANQESPTSLTAGNADN
jgi:hypothetical protein